MSSSASKLTAINLSVGSPTNAQKSRSYQLVYNWEESFVFSKSNQMHLKSSCYQLVSNREECFAFSKTS